MNIIFFGNQKLVQGITSNVTTITDALAQAGHKIIAVVTTKAQLSTLPTVIASEAKQSSEKPIAILASYGHIIPQHILDLFEPIGILNLHPSLLPHYRGTTPIETAILNGDTETGISIMKLTPKMDAGPIYAQAPLKISQNDNKFTLAVKLTTLGTTILIDLLPNVVNFTTQLTPQDESQATYTEKLDKSMSILQPSTKTAAQLERQIRAHLGFPKSKYTYHDIECTILKAHVDQQSQTPLDLKCTDGNYLIIDTLQPASRTPMSAADFLRGYTK